jgi:hypothetical protein
MWACLKGDPMSACVIALIAGLAAWWCTRLYDKRALEQISILKERLALRDEEIIKLKQALKDAATPARRTASRDESSPTTKNLSLVFDPRTHRVQDGDLIQYFVGVRNTGDAPVHKASVTIEDIKSLDDPIGMARRLAKLRGWTLLLKEDMHKQNEQPKKDFYIFGHSDVELIVMKGQTQGQWITLQHTEGSLGPGRSMNGLKAWTPVRQWLPAGKYRLSLLLRGSDGTVQRKTFLTSLDTERFDFGEVTDDTATVS